MAARFAIPPCLMDPSSRMNVETEERETALRRFLLCEMNAIPCSLRKQKSLSLNGANDETVIDLAAVKIGRRSSTGFQSST